MSFRSSFPSCAIQVPLLVAWAAVVLGCNDGCVCAGPGSCRIVDWDEALDGGNATDPALSVSGVTHVPAPCRQDHLQALQLIRTINLAGNRLTCDCHMTWLLHWYREPVGRQLLGSCSLPSSLRSKKLADLSEADLECNEVFLTACPNPFSPSGVQLTCGTRGGGEIPPDRAWMLRDGIPLQKEPGTLAVPLLSNVSSAVTRWQCEANLPTPVRSPIVNTSTLAGRSRCVVWGQQNNGALRCAASGVGGAGGGATSAIFSSLSVEPVRNWTKCKGDKGGNKCLPSGGMLVTAQRDLKSEGSLCPTLHGGHVFVVESGWGLLAFGDGRSYRYIFRSLRKVAYYRLDVHLAPAPGNNTDVLVLVRVNKELVAEVHVSQNQSSVSVITRTFKQTSYVVVELELVHLVNVSDFAYERPRVVVTKMSLEQLVPPVLSAEDNCKSSQEKQAGCQKEVALQPTHLRNNTNGTIALQVNGIYLPNLSESAIVTIATREDSQFEFTIKIQHKLLRDSEGGAPLQHLILSFSTVDNLTNPLLPADLQSIVQPVNSLLGTLDIRAVFQQSHLFSDSMAKDLNMWHVDVSYRLLDRNGSFVWRPLSSPHMAAAAKPGDDLQQSLNQLPPYAKLTLAPGEYRQSLVVRKPVSILSSDGANRTVIYGHVTIKSDNVTLVGLTIHPVNGSAAVTTSYASTAIYNSIISNPKGGKIPSDTTKNISGIACVGCKGLSIRNTLINSMTEGVSLTSSRDVVIVNSVISSCIRGLVIRQSSNGIICQNLFQNNQIANKKDKKSSVSYQNNVFHRNLQSFNRVVKQNGSTLTGPSPVPDDRLGLPTVTPPYRLPKPTNGSPFGTQSPTTPMPTSPPHSVYMHAPTKDEISSLQVSMSCNRFTAQKEDWSALMSKLTSRTVDSNTCAAVLGSVLLFDTPAAPQTGGILATNAPGPLQRGRSKRVLARVWIKEKHKWLSHASLSLVWKGTVVTSQLSDHPIGEKLTKNGTYTALLHDGLNVLDAATLEVVEVSCRSNGVLRPIEVQVGETFKLKCPLCVEEKGSPVRYMWYRDGEVIPGEDGKVLRVTSAAMQHAGGYHCRVAGQPAGSTIVDVAVQG